MKNNQIKDEIVYQLTMKYVKKMLEQKIITLKEYIKIDSELKEKYALKISPLFLEMSWIYLIYTYFRVIYSSKEMEVYYA